MNKWTYCRKHKDQRYYRSKGKIINFFQFGQSRNDMKDNLSVQNLENNLVIVAKILNRGIYL